MGGAIHQDRRARADKWLHKGFRLRDGRRAPEVDSDAASWLLSAGLGRKKRPPPAVNCIWCRRIESSRVDAVLPSAAAAADLILARAGDNCAQLQPARRRRQVARPTIDGRPTASAASLPL